MSKRFCHYDSNNFKIIGFYSEESHGESIPLPKVEVTLGNIEEVNNKQYTHVIITDEGVSFERIENEKTAEELRREFKRSRTTIISNLTVEIDGMVFDADEISRSRMADTIVGLADDETQLWVLADNSIVYLTKMQLIEVLRAIGTAQTALWLPTS